jgi:tetratricopeptide (TPR) repeat protein
MGMSTRVLPTGTVTMVFTDIEGSTQLLERAGERGIASDSGPGSGDGDLDALARVPSVALLLERARSAAPGFALTAGNARAVRELCARLDGLPLALELAAARLDVIEPAALVRRLDVGLDALGAGGRGRPDRHRGLRAALDWTFALLTPEERAALGRLSVFRGGFTLELAEAALGDVVEELAKLRDVGLVRRDDDGRFSMAPPVRRYAADMLAEAGEEQEAARGMAAALTDLAREWEEAWFIPFADAARVLNAEAANILEALTWSRAADPLLHADLAAAVGWWLPYSGRREAAAEHLPVALATAGDDVVLRARVNEALGVGGPASVDPDGPMRAVETWRELGNRRRLAAALWEVANNHFHFGRVEEAERAATEGLEVATSLNDEALILDSHVQLGQAALVAGRPEDAIEIIQADSMVVALAQLDRTEDAALALALSELLHAQYAMPVIGPADEYAELATKLPPESRERGRDRAARIGAGGAIAWFRGVGSATVQRGR